MDSMALLCTLAGATSGERGLPLLQCANNYLRQVKQRTELSENEPSKDWLRLQLAVLNNQAFVLNELCQYKEAALQLAEMKSRLRLSASILDIGVWQEFTLNLQCLRQSCEVAGAA